MLAAAAGAVLVADPLRGGLWGRRNFEDSSTSAWLFRGSTMTLSVLVLVIVLLGIALLSGMKNVEIPESMQRAIAREAEAVREKRARLIKAEPAEQLRRASEIIMQNPAGLELRRMQMLTKLGASRTA
jgi:hypothetical protein